jgi:hypothetical protein
MGPRAYNAVSIELRCGCNFPSCALVWPKFVGTTGNTTGRGSSQTLV